MAGILVVALVTAVLAAQAPEPDRVSILEHQIALEPAKVANYLALVRIHEEAGRMDAAAAVLERVQVADPWSVEVWAQTAYFYNRGGDFDRAMAAFARVAEIEPHNPQHLYVLAVYYEERVRKDFSLPRPKQVEYLERGMDALDRALALKADYFEALVYKGLLLRQQARFESDPARVEDLIRQAEALQQEAMAVRKRTGAAVR